MFLGLDLASRLTGWCCGDGAQVPTCGAWTFPQVDGDYGLLLATLEDYLDVVFGRFPITAVAYEAPILVARGGPGRQYGDKLSTLRLLYPMGAFVEWYCHRRGVPCYEVTVQSIKREVTGNVHAPKDDLVAVAQNCGLALPAGDAARDAADAWGAWLLLLRAHDDELAVEWHRKIWTPKGALL